MPDKPQKIGQDRYLFEDPLKDDENFKKPLGPVLLAREIDTYARKYGLLIATNYEKGKLKGASYSMTADPTYKAWRFSENSEKVTLEVIKGENGNKYYEVPKNSLVYIRLLQKLKLPYYIIGRFNLKVSYTYKGLLLGTGPQVDPGYEANLNIPLHNFTNDPVKIYLDESFVSIDFVRTAPLELGHKTPKSRDELLDNKESEVFKELCPQDSRKLERKEIEDYVKEERPTSFMGGFVPELKENQKKVNKSLKSVQRSRYWNWGVSAVLFLALFVAMYTAYYHLDSKLESKELSIRGDLQRLRAIEARQSDFKQMLQGVAEQLSRINELKREKDIYTSLTKLKNAEYTIKALGKRIEKLEKKVGTVD